jgi:hypothetical protein
MPDAIAEDTEQVGHAGRHQRGRHAQHSVVLPRRAVALAGHKQLLKSAARALHPVQVPQRDPGLVCQRGHGAVVVSVSEHFFAR